MSESKPPKVFISYSHQDEEWKDRLCLQLNVLGMEGLLSIWDDRKITEGDDWYPEIEAALKSCDIALMLISAHFLTSSFIRRKEVPALLERRKQEGIRVIPVIIDHCQWQKVGWLSAIQGGIKDNEVLSDLEKNQYTKRLSDLAGRVYDLVDEAKSEQPKPSTAISASAPIAEKNILIDQLPTVAGDFFGRTKELQILDEALSNPDTKVIQFIAAGGTGKTKLLRHWLNEKQQQGKIQNRIIWSFYSQGTTDTKQVSASPLFEAGFKAFGINPDQFKTDEDRADAFADAVIQRQCLLVLDGLEPMQHGGRGMDGRLKDRAMIRLLKRLVNSNDGPLCVITSRIPVYELSDRIQAKRHGLNNLETDDGIQLLRAYQVQGRDSQLKALVEKVSGHALTLHLLGNAIHCQLDDELEMLDTLTDWFTDTSNTDRHAFRVMQQYDVWLRNEQGEPDPELRVLYLLGLFDHPIEKDVLQVLWDQQIPGLTQGIEKAQWKTAIQDLIDKLRLLSQLPKATSNGKQVFDCHPLIREYFGGKLETDNPEAWKQAHTCLYDFYKDLPDKEYPDTLEEMRPLFHALAHGCAAGLYEQVFSIVYLPRINRGTKFFLTQQLGAYSDDLTGLAHFFKIPWLRPVDCLSLDLKGTVLNWTGFALQAVGRYGEALTPMKEALKLRVHNRDWRGIATNAINISEVQLNLGNIDQSGTHARLAVENAYKTPFVNDQLDMQVAFADILAHAGLDDETFKLFEVAKDIQREMTPENSDFGSIAGFRYCNFLLEQALKLPKVDKERLQQIIDRAQRELSISRSKAWVQSSPLFQIVLTKAFLMTGPSGLPEAARNISDVQEQLARGRFQYLPLGLITRAHFYRLKREFTLAQQDLDEVYDIAEPSGMRLHLTDYHLESARLGLAAGWPTENIQQHIQQADQLIQATGYHCRDRELAELKGQLI